MVKLIVLTSQEGAFTRKRSFLKLDTIISASFQLNFSQRKHE